MGQKERKKERKKERYYHVPIVGFEQPWTPCRLNLYPSPFVKMDFTAKEESKLTGIISIWLLYVRARVYGKEEKEGDV